MSNVVLDKEDLTSPVEAPDSDKVAHIILEGFGSEDGKEFLSAQELGFPGGSVVDSMVFGTEITALCGQKLIAKNSPENRPVCQACLSIAQEMGWKVPDN